MEKLKLGKFTSTESAELNNHKDFPALCKAKKAGLFLPGEYLWYLWPETCLASTVSKGESGIACYKTRKWLQAQKILQFFAGLLLNKCPTNHVQEQSFSFQRWEPYFCVNLVTCISHNRWTRRSWVFSQWVSTSRSLRQPWVMWDFVLGQSHSTLFILCAHNKVLGKQNERTRSKTQKDLKELQLWATALYRVSFMVCELHINKAACIHTPYINTNTIM